MIDSELSSALTASVFVTDQPEAEDVALISDALDGFNVEETGIDDRRQLAVLVRDPESRRVVGGLTGRTSLGLLFVDLFYLPPALRGSGVLSANSAASADRRGSSATPFDTDTIPAMSRRLARRRTIVASASW